jgi:DNA-binding MarR family transcriptional regulator
MDPIGRTLNPEEQAILTILTQEGRSPGDCTATGLAVSLERDPLDVTAALTRLERDDLVARDGAPGHESWSVRASL